MSLDENQEEINTPRDDNVITDDDILGSPIEFDQQNNNNNINNLNNDYLQPAAYSRQDAGNDSVAAYSLNN